MNLNGPELFIILLIVLLLFGAGRVSRVGREMGTAIREFRKGIQGEDETPPSSNNNQNDNKQA
ncbi:MAG: twin-arginine translocase TatA/TatE family subunit [Anaerolineales bacterium]|nr:twin-arginine translocase TatA/TatE family subunit [Anaerolineales bacterium]